MDLGAIATGAKEYWEAMLTVVAFGGASWRYVVRPCRRGVTSVKVALAKVDAMSAALGPNGGKSLADQISQTHKLATDANHALWTLDARVSDLSDHIERLLFEADARGLIVRVNVSLERAFGYLAAELAGSGWEQLIAPEDRDRVRREWTSSVHEKRSYITRATCVTAAGIPLKVIMRAHPWFNPATGAVIGWSGQVEIERKAEAAA